MNKFLSINTIAEIICFLTAAVFLTKDKNPIWRLFTVYLLITCITEEVGLILKRHGIMRTNVFIYNILLLFESLFMSLMFLNIICHYRNFRPIFYSGLFLATFIFILEAIIHGLYIYNNITTTIISILFIGYGLYYYYLLIKDEDYYRLGKHAPFWWVAGTLFFYFGTTVSDLYFSIFNTKAALLFTHRYLIYNYLNIVLYGFWGYSFVCRYRQRKLTY